MAEKEKKAVKQPGKNLINWDRLGAFFKTLDKKIMNYNYKQLLGFEKTYSILAIKFIYWLGIVLISVGSIYSILTPESGMGFIRAVIGWPFYLIVLRISCELYIVIFGIYERLGDIRKELSKK